MRSNLPTLATLVAMLGTAFPTVAAENSPVAVKVTGAPPAVRVEQIRRGVYNTRAKKIKVSPRSWGATFVTVDGTVTTLLVQWELDEKFELAVSRHEACHREQLLKGLPPSEVPCEKMELETLNLQHPGWADGLDAFASSVSVRGRGLRLPTEIAVGLCIKRLGVKGTQPNREYLFEVLSRLFNGGGSHAIASR